MTYAMEDNIAACMRMCLLGKEDDLQHILDVGIEDANWYHNASELFVMLDNIHESKRTVDEISKLKRLFKIVDEYEEKYYKYGN